MYAGRYFDLADDIEQTVGREQDDAGRQVVVESGRQQRSHAAVVCTTQSQSCRPTQTPPPVCDCWQRVTTTM